MQWMLYVILIILINCILTNSLKKKNSNLKYIFCIHFYKNNFFFLIINLK